MGQLYSLLKYIISCFWWLSIGDQDPHSHIRVCLISWESAGMDDLSRSCTLVSKAFRYQELRKHFRSFIFLLQIDFNNYFYKQFNEGKNCMKESVPNLLCGHWNVCVCEIHLIINVKTECLLQVFTCLLLCVQIYKTTVYETNITSIFKSRKMSCLSPVSLTVSSQIFQRGCFGGGVVFASWTCTSKKVSLWYNGTVCYFVFFFKISFL